ncbi:DNA methyltransferase [Brevibacillus nitrificans]|uniref:DNA methyltransferase n=1 Tax=Brevibacillus nitrificans TaxID=651560 RepID=UPI002E1C2E12|nr:DNA methyltransferase [Brevibacillus nitrificans]
MRIENKPIDEIFASSWNPNEMDDRVFEALVRSVKTHGVLQPILVRDDFTIIKGEKRWKAAKAAGLSEIICVIVETSEEEAKLLTITLSNLRGTTNEELLASLISELSQHFSLERIAIETGILNEELETMIAALSSDVQLDMVIIDDDFDVQKALDEINEPETRRGDVWKLGRHFLMCGDATDPEDVKSLMNGRKGNLVVTDPPYNVAVESTSDRLSSDGRAKILNDDMPVEDFKKFLGLVFMNYSSHMDKNAAIYVFHPSSYQREFEDAMNAANILVRTQCVWVKNQSTFGFAQYKFKHEPVFYAHLKGQSPAWYGDRKQTTVWKSGIPVDDSIPESVWEVSRGNLANYVHPTQKPLELLSIPIKNSSLQGDIVVDFFGGSGSTLMTCEQLDRQCLTMELDPVFCDVIKRRYHGLTGLEPVLYQRALQ